MPIYEYRCTNDHRFEVMQRIVEDPLTECEVCGAPATRVLHPVAIHFKGSGFYSTDYGRGKKVAADGRAEASSGDSKSKDGDSKSSDSTKSSDSKTSAGSGKGSETKKAAEG
jgi:putative FmdB family regulatory protein